MNQQSPYMSIFLMLVMLAFIIPMIIGMWKVFDKAGQAGWKCLVPVYNLVVMLKIVGKPMWWVICITGSAFVSVLGTALGMAGMIYLIFSFALTILCWVFSIWMLNMMSKSFGKEEGFTAGLVLLPFIFIPILGFGSSRYEGPYGDPVLFREHKNQNGDRFDFENDMLV